MPGLPPAMSVRSGLGLPLRPLDAGSTPRNVSEIGSGTAIAPLRRNAGHLRDKTNEIDQLHSNDTACPALRSTSSLGGVPRSAIATHMQPEAIEIKKAIPGGLHLSVSIGMYRYVPHGSFQLFDPRKNIEGEHRRRPKLGGHNLCPGGFDRFQTKKRPKLGGHNLCPGGFDRFQTKKRPKLGGHNLCPGGFDRFDKLLGDGTRDIP
jgi:hypothetical protein